MSCHELPSNHSYPMVLELRTKLGEPVGAVSCVEIEGNPFFLTAKSVADKLYPSAVVALPPLGNVIPTTEVPFQFRIQCPNHTGDLSLFTGPTVQLDESFRLATNPPRYSTRLCGFLPFVRIRPVDLRAEILYSYGGSYCVTTTNFDYFRGPIEGMLGGAMHVGHNLFGIVTAFEPPNRFICSKLDPLIR